MATDLKLCSFKLPKEIREILASRAKERGCTMTDLIVDAFSPCNTIPVQIEPAERPSMERSAGPIAAFPQRTGGPILRPSQKRK